MKRLPALCLLALAAMAADAAASPAPAAPGSVIRCAVPMLSEVLPRPRPEHFRQKPAVPAIRRAELPSREFWAWDLAVMPPGFRRVQTTLRAHGEHCLIYVEDAEWGRTVDQTAIDTILTTFESTTPRHPDRGIAEVDREAFGEIPLGLDGEPRVIILFTKMGLFQGQGFDGFFNAFDTMTEETAWNNYQQHSNEAEILYLNTDGHAPGSDYMLSVLSHELVHLLAHPHDPEESAWVGETLGEAGMLLCGYDTDQAHARRYASRPSTPLVTEPYVSYGACLMLAANFVDQQPAGFLKRLTAEPARGVEGLEKTLESFGPSDGFEGVLERFFAGNLVSGLGSESPDYAYTSVHVPAMAATPVAASGLAPTAGKLQATGVLYLRFEATGRYELRLDSAGPAPMRVLAIQSPASETPVVEPLSAGVEPGVWPVDARAGDCLALYGLTPGVYNYAVRIVPVPPGAVAR